VTLLLRFAAGVVLLYGLGAGILLLTGAWRECAGLVRALLGVFAGAALAAVVLPWFVYLGVAPAVPLVTALAAVSLAAGVVVERRRAVVERRSRPRTFSVGQIVWLSAPFVVLAVRGFAAIGGAYDAFSNWVLKAKLLYFAGNGLLDDRIIELAFATNGSLPVERAYPIGLPSLEAFVMHVTGAPGLRPVDLLAVVMLAGVAAIAVLVLRSHVTPWLLAGGIAFVGWMPAIRDQVVSGNADVPLACFWVSSALLLWRHLATRHPGELALAALFAAAAVATKREGAVYVVALWGLALIAGGGRRRPLLAAGLAVGVTAVPWRVFVAANDLRGHDIEPSAWRIAQHVERLPLILRELWQHLVDAPFFGAVPLAVVAAVLLLRNPPARRAALAYLAMTALLLLILVLVYVNTRVGAAYLLRTSLDRTLVTPSLLAAVLLPLLLAYRFGAGPSGSEADGDGERRRQTASQRNRRIPIAANTAANAARIPSSGSAAEAPRPRTMASWRPSMR
jgi:hypothetical protein